MQKDKIEGLKIKIEDLRSADIFNFPNLKELVISIVMGPKKQNGNKAETKKQNNNRKSIKTGKFRQLSIEDAFSHVNQSKDKLNEQWVMEQLSILLSKSPNLESFYFGYSFVRNLPSEIWHLEKLKSLTLKKLKITKISDAIKNLKNCQAPKD